MQSDAVVTTVRGERVTVSDVIAHLKRTGLFRTAIYELIEVRVIEQAAADLKLTPSPQAIEQLSQSRRHELGITDNDTFERYLKFQGISRSYWMKCLRQEALRLALKDHIATSRRISEAFKRDPRRYATVSISRIVCENRTVAEKVSAMAREGEVDFLLLARDHSTDESTRMSGGYIGNVGRGILPPEVEEPAFAAQAGTILGPIRAAGLWTVYKVHAVNLPKLSDTLRAALADQIFSEWLRQQVCTVPA